MPQKPKSKEKSKQKKNKKVKTETDPVSDDDEQVPKAELKAELKDESKEASIDEPEQVDSDQEDDGSEADDEDEDSDPDEFTSDNESSDDETEQKYPNTPEEFQKMVTNTKASYELYQHTGEDSDFEAHYDSDELEVQYNSYPKALTSMDQLVLTNTCEEIVQPTDITSFSELRYEYDTKQKFFWIPTNMTPCYAFYHAGFPMIPKNAQTLRHMLLKGLTMRQSETVTHQILYHLLVRDVSELLTRKLQIGEHKFIIAQYSPISNKCTGLSYLSGPIASYVPLAVIWSEKCMRHSIKPSERTGSVLKELSKYCEKIINDS